MSWIEDIGAYLVSKGIGSVGNDIAYGEPRAEIKNCVALSDQPGSSAKTTLNGKIALECPELGVIIRNQSSKIAHDKADLIYEQLKIITNTTIGNTRFKRIKATSSPYLLSQDRVMGTEYQFKCEIQIVEVKS